MATTHAPIVLFHYPLSPWGAKVAAYLVLRGIQYAECHQPLHWPRPDLTDHFNIQYRRIPVLAIGRDFYYDTSLIFEKLEALFPETKYLMPEVPAEQALTKLVDKWADTTVMKTVPHALPPDSPLWKDEKFLNDRIELWGDQFSHEARKKQHPGALAELRLHYGLLEDMLADGREWLLGSESPKLADIHAAFALQWLANVPHALPKQFFSEVIYPRTHAYLARYKDAVESAKDIAPRPTILSGSEAAQTILRSEYAETGGVVMGDPTGLQQGQVVAVYRNDDLSSKRKHRDIGSLVALTPREVAITKEVRPSVEIRIHCPRWQFVVEAADS